MPAHGEGRGMGASAKLNTFDVTSLVVGSIIGADVYVATAIGARLIGPSSLLAWVLAGGGGGVTPPSLSPCVVVLPNGGGPPPPGKREARPLPRLILRWGLPPPGGCSP